MRRCTLRTLLTAALIVAALTPHAYAQQGATASPLTVERVDNRFVVAPDFKATDVDHELGQLAGIYGGTLLDDRVLIGAAAYWLANGSDSSRLTYGGLLVGWATPDTSRIRFGVRGLAGVGTATLPAEADATFTRGALPSPSIRFGTRTPPRLTPDIGLMRTIRFALRDDFLVFEPQGIVGLSVTDHILINVGAGYRAVALTDALRDRVDGATGSIAVEFDW